MLHYSYHVEHEEIEQLEIPKSKALSDFGPEGITASTIVKPTRNYGPALRLNVIATCNNPDAPNLSEWSTCER